MKRAILAACLFAATVSAQIWRPSLRGTIAGGPPQMYSTNLVAWYDCRQGVDATVLYDVSGNSRNGTLGAGGAAPTWTASGLQFTRTKTVSLSLPDAQAKTYVAVISNSDFSAVQMLQDNSAATFKYSLGAFNSGWYIVGHYASDSTIQAGAGSPAFVAQSMGQYEQVGWNNLSLFGVPQTALPGSYNLTTITGIAGTLHCLGVYEGTLDDASMQKVYAFAAYYAGVSIPRGSFVRKGTLNAFGNSITAGTGASDGAHAFTALVGAAKGRSINNKGVSGSQVGGQTTNIYGANIAPHSDTVYLTGYNDMRNYGTNAAGQSTYQNALMAHLAWMALPNSSKVNGKSAAVTYTGTWADTAAYGIGKNSATAGSTAQFTVTGTTLYIGYISFGVGSGQFSVTVDGVERATVNCYGNSTDGNGVSYLPGLYRLTGLSAGSHTILLTVIGAGTTYFDWAGGSSMSDKPHVYVGNCLKMNAAGYAAGSPNWNKGSDAAVAQFNSIIATAVTTLTGDGLFVRLVDASATYDPATMVGADNIHPNDAGHSAIANAFLAAM